MEKKGKILKISGPLVVAEYKNPKLYELVYVGEEGLIGEVIKVEGNKAFIQVYEDTTGLEVGEIVIATDKPLTVELGPGLLTRIYDGLQRPLDIIGGFIKKGYKGKALDRSKEWEFIPKVKKGDIVKQGYIIGEVKETEIINHKIMIPPNLDLNLNKEFEVVEVYEGKFKVEDTVAIIKDKSGKEYEIKLYHEWPIRKPRPFKETLEPIEPLKTYIRVFDFMFPIAKGGSSAIPGPFGSGKTVSLHALLKNSEADVSIFVGCGERGNEMADALISLKKLEDPKTKRPLLEKVVLIANTSNMPVAAREASIFTGITIAQYYRDMGYNVIFIADSISRWAEALREIGGRLGEMPVEEGFPGYLSSRLASFYEKARRVVNLNNTLGSVTIVNSVSPPGGDFSEPVTQTVLKYVKAFWALDKDLANKRHFPAINWNISYSLYVETVSIYYEKEGYKDYLELRKFVGEVLEEENKLQEIVKIVGPEALPEDGKLILKTGRLIREGFLQQDLLSEEDMKSPLDKTFKIIRIIKVFYDKGKELIERGDSTKTLDKYIPEILRLRWIKDLNEFNEKVNQILTELNKV